MKKGQAASLMTLASVVLIFLLAGMAAIYSLDILDDSREEFCDYNYVQSTETCYQCNVSHADFNTTVNQCYNNTGGEHVTARVTQDVSFNATSDAVDGIAKVPDKMGTLGNVAIAAIIIGVLLASFGGFIAYKQR